MKKSLITLMGMLALLLSGCTSIKMTSNTLEVPTSIYSYNKADLVVSEERIYFTYYPERAVWREGIDNTIKAAISEALKKHKADILVAMNYEIKVKTWFFGQKCVKYVTVSGLPGYYRNVRPADPKDFITNKEGSCKDKHDKKHDKKKTIKITIDND